MMQIGGRNPAQATFAVQGMGAMGAAVLRHFSETGARLAAIGDPRYAGTWSFDRPLSVALRAALVRQDIAAAMPLLGAEAKKVSNSAEDVLYLPADILFPCAVQNVITDGNVDRVQAGHLCEGANGPITEAARSRLHARGIPLVPDFIANPGGAIAAFVELTSTSADKVEEAKRMTRDKIAANVRTLFEIAECNGCEPQHAAMYMALTRIRETAGRTCRS
jgi:glutamate dehydrogenase (NAD(P)+)